MVRCGEMHRLDEDYAYGKANRGQWHLFHIASNSEKIFRTWKALKKYVKRQKVKRMKNETNKKPGMESK